MISIPRPLALFLTGACAALWLGLAVPADLAAQDRKTEEAAAVEAITTAKVEDVGVRGAAVLGKLDEVLKTQQRLDKQLVTATREDSLVIRIQRARTRDRFMEAMRELADILVLAQDDPSQQELKARGEVVFAGVTPTIWGLMGSLREEIDERRARRPETEPRDLATLEDEIVLLTLRLDRFIAYGWFHIQKLEALGLPAAGDRETFLAVLTDRAEELSGRLELGSMRVKKYKERLRELPGDADLTARLMATRKSFEANIASQTKVLDILDELGQANENYRTQLVVMTQNVAAGLRDAKVAARLLRQAWNGIRTWMTEHGSSFLVKILVFLFIVLAGRFLAPLVSRAVEKSLGRSRVKMSHLLKRMIVTFTHNTTMVLALVLGLAQLGLSLGPLLAGFGVVGFILGFAMQDSLSNLAAGMMILINRPYDVGDLVEVSGVFGKVQHMSMVSTSVLTLDNQKLVVPNSKIWGDVIKNVTDQRIRRVDMTFGISYSDDIPHAERVLIEILESHEKVLDDPEPMVRLHTLNESSVDFVVRPWVRTEDYWDIYWDVTREVKMRFDAEGISIPFPQRDVHFYEQKKLAGIPEDHSGSGHEPVVRKPVEKTGQDAPDVE